MTDVEKIRSAEARVAELQEMLGKVQSGLERAETVAVGAEAAREKAERLLKATAALSLLAIVLVIVFRRRRSA